MALGLLTKVALSLRSRQLEPNIQNFAEGERLERNIREKGLNRVKGNFLLEWQRTSSNLLLQETKLSDSRCERERVARGPAKSMTVRYVYLVARSGVIPKWPKVLATRNCQARIPTREVQGVDTTLVLYAKYGTVIYNGRVSNCTVV